jgi:uncharacterized membrane protein YdjX (TVP38/TMEM64 family)
MVEFVLAFIIGVTFIEVVDASVKVISIIIAAIVAFFAVRAHRSAELKNKKEAELLEQKIGEQMIKNLKRSQNESNRDSD